MPVTVTWFTSVDADRFSPEFMAWYRSLQRNTSTMPEYERVPITGFWELSILIKSLILINPP